MEGKGATAILIIMLVFILSLVVEAKIYCTDEDQRRVYDFCRDKLDLPAIYCQTQAECFERDLSPFRRDIHSFCQMGPAYSKCRAKCLSNITSQNTGNNGGKAVIEEIKRCNKACSVICTKGINAVSTA